MIEARVRWHETFCDWFFLSVGTIEEARTVMNRYFMTRLDDYRGKIWEVREVPDNDIPEA